MIEQQRADLRMSYSDQADLPMSQKWRDEMQAGSARRLEMAPRQSWPVSTRTSLPLSKRGSLRQRRAMPKVESGTLAKSGGQLRRTATRLSKKNINERELFQETLQVLSLQLPWPLDEVSHCRMSFEGCGRSPCARRISMAFSLDRALQV